MAPDDRAVAVDVALGAVAALLLPGGDGAEGRQIALAVGGVRRGREGLAAQFGDRAPDDPLQRAIAIEQAAVAIDESDADEEVVEECAPPSFAFRRRRLGGMQRGQVGGGRDERGERAMIIRNGGDLPGERSCATRLRAVVGDAGERKVLCGGIGEPAAETPNPLRPGQEVPERPPDDLAGGATEQFRAGAIGVHNPTCGIEHEEWAADGVEEGCVVTASASERFLFVGIIGVYGCGWHAARSMPPSSGRGLRDKGRTLCNARRVPAGAPCHTGVRHLGGAIRGALR